jgi:hypothetical protein
MPKPKIRLQVNVAVAAEAEGDGPERISRLLFARASLRRPSESNACSIFSVLWMKTMRGPSGPLGLMARATSSASRSCSDDRSAGLAGAEGGETIERCAIPLDLLIEALSYEFAEADTNRIPMTSGRQSAANDSMYCRHRAFPRFTLLIAIR